jgi:hypothetical protein
MMYIILGIVIVITLVTNTITVQVKKNNEKSNIVY